MSGNSTNPGVYPGNPSLPREVRDKILSTFRHTLNLYQEGKIDDCLIGCDFILKMDPRFSPARRLLEKAKNPAAEVDIVELEAIVATTTARPRAPAADVEKMLVRAVESFNARDFDACIATAEQVLTALPGNAHATEILEKARRKKAVQADFEAARHRAIAALDTGRPADAARELERMRSLDPDHPSVPLLEPRIKAAAPAAAAPEPQPGGLMDLGQSPSDLDAHFGAPPQEPRISFGAPGPSTGGDLDSLSLDSLSLDAAPTAVPPPADLSAGRRGPLDLGGAGPARPERGSPGDLWSEPGTPEEPAAAPPPPPPRPPEAPARPKEEQDAGAAEREIAHLLQQGDEAAARGDHQAAIEVWSRIFLIDINSVEAVTRIEKARQEMAEGNRRMAEGLKSGRERFEAGDFARAREAFLQVLAVDGNETTARSYLDRIEKELASGRPGPAPQETQAGGARAEPELEPGPAVEPPPPAAAPRRRAALRVGPKVAVLAAVFVAIVAGGAFLVLRQPKPPAAAPSPARPAGSLKRATAFFQQGKMAAAVAELKRIPRTDPDYSKARELLASLTASPGAAPAATAPAAATPSAASASGPAATNEPARLRARAEKALAEKRYIDALKDFSLAAPAFQGDPTFAKEMGTASDKVTELTPAVKLYNDGEYETAIPALWRIYQEDRDNQDARSYLLRCYYNQGVTRLQNGLYEKAKQSFDEALALDPQDVELARHRKFAQRYQKGDLDLMGRIYVRHLSHRP